MKRGRIWEYKVCTGGRWFGSPCSPSPLKGLLYFSFSKAFKKEQKYCVAFLFKFSISARATDSASYTVQVM